MGIVSAKSWEKRNDSRRDFESFDAAKRRGVAAVRLRAWGDDIRVSVPDVATVNAVAVKDGAEFDCGDFKVAYRGQESLTFPSGSVWTPERGLMAVDITLARKPKINVFPMRLELPANSMLWEQPPLTQDEIDDGCFRPDWCVNSLALYSQDGRKLGHFPRPFAIDRNGAWTWGDWQWDGQNLAKVFDADWLKNAAYPVVLDDTFGDTDIGASTHSATYNYQVAFGAHQPASSGNATDVYVYGAGGIATADLKLGLFENTVATAPNTVAHNGGEHSNIGISAGWFSDSGLSISVDSSKYYWMAILSNADFTNYYDAAGSGIGRWWDSQSYASGFTTWDGSTIKNNNRSYSAYAVYTPSGGNAPTGNINGPLSGPLAGVI